MMYIKNKPLSVTKNQKQMTVLMPQLVVVGIILFIALAIPDGLKPATSIFLLILGFFGSAMYPPVGLTICILTVVLSSAIIGTDSGNFGKLIAVFVIAGIMVRRIFIEKQRPRILNIIKPMLPFLAAIIVAELWSGQNSFKYDYLNIIVCFMFFVLTQLCISNTKELSMSICGLALAGLCCAIVSLAAGGAYRLENEQLVALGDPNTLSLFIGASLPFVLYLIISSKILWLKIFAGAAIILDTVTLVFAASRGVIIALAIAMLPIVRRQKYGNLFFLLVLLVAAISLAPTDALDYTMQRFKLGTAGSERSFYQRKDLVGDGFTALFNNPMGTGISSSGDAIASVNPSYGDQKNPHNVYIQVGLESGFLGLAAFMLLIFIAFKNVLRFMATGSPFYNSGQINPGIYILSSLLVVVIGSVFLGNMLARIWYITLGLACSLSNLSYEKSNVTKIGR